jgi:hypothetical protein
VAYQPFLCGEENKGEKDGGGGESFGWKLSLLWITAAWHSGLHPAKVLVRMLRHWTKLNKSAFSGPFPGETYTSKIVNSVFVLVRPAAGIELGSAQKGKS